MDEYINGYDEVDYELENIESMIHSAQRIADRTGQLVFIYHDDGTGLSITTDSAYAIMALEVIEPISKPKTKTRVAE